MIALEMVIAVTVNVNVCKVSPEVIAVLGRAVENAAQVKTLMGNAIRLANTFSNAHAKLVSLVKTAQSAGAQTIALVMVFAYKNTENINAIAVPVGVVQHATKRLAQINVPAMENALEKSANKDVYAPKVSWAKIVARNIALRDVVAMDYAQKGLAYASQDSPVKHVRLVLAQLV